MDRTFAYHSILYASPVTPAPNPASGLNPVHSRDIASPKVPESDDVHHAAFLSKPDSNDTHDTNREAFGKLAPSPTASNSAYLGEAGSNDGQVRGDAQYRPPDPADASDRAFLGEADSDDEIEG